MFLFIHDVMDDISEQHEIANKIVTAVSNRAGVGGGVGQDIDEVTFLSKNMYLCSLPVYCRVVKKSKVI
jgi:hypothetical protein